MHLTKFELNPARRGARSLLGSPQTMHAAVLAGFPSGESGRVLWRVDRHQTGAYLYILSSEPPDLTHLVEQAGRPATQTWDTRDYTPVIDRLRVGQTYGFRLSANPTRSTRVKDGERSQRVGHVTVDQQVHWLHSRADRLGMHLGREEEPSFRVVERGVRTFSRNGSRVTLAVAVFEGILEVSDPEALRSAITSGVGPAKAYGCGLLTLAPAPQRQSP